LILEKLGSKTVVAAWLIWSFLPHGERQSWCHWNGLLTLLWKLLNRFPSWQKANNVFLPTLLCSYVNHDRLHIVNITFLKYVN
jgi:hypothetical protein